MGIHGVDFRRKVVTVQSKVDSKLHATMEDHSAARSNARVQPKPFAASPFVHKKQPPPTSSSHSATCASRYCNLPAEVVLLKNKLQANRECKTSRFSFSAMRRIAVPPVKLPEELENPLACTSLVSGRCVPFTKAMHKKHQDQVTCHTLDTIPENFERRSFDSLTKAQRQAAQQMSGRRQVSYGSISVAMKRV